MDFMDMLMGQAQQTQQAGRIAEGSLRQAIESDVVRMPDPPQMIDNPYRNPWVALGMSLQGRSAQAVQGAMAIDAENKRRMDAYQARALEAENYRALRQQRLSAELAQTISQNAKDDFSARMSIYGQIRQAEIDKVTLEHQARMAGLEERRVQELEASGAARRKQEEKELEIALKGVDIQFAKLGIEGEIKDSDSIRELMVQFGLPRDKGGEGDRKDIYDFNIDILDQMASSDERVIAVPGENGKPQPVEITPAAIAMFERAAINQINSSAILMARNSLKAQLIEAARNQADAARAKHGFVTADQGPGAPTGPPPDARDRTLIEPTSMEKALLKQEERSIQRTAEQAPNIGLFDALDFISGSLSLQDSEELTGTRALENMGEITREQRVETERQMLLDRATEPLAKIGAKNLGEVSGEDYAFMYAYLDQLFPPGNVKEDEAFGTLAATGVNQSLARKVSRRFTQRRRSANAGGEPRRLGRDPRGWGYRTARVRNPDGTVSTVEYQNTYRRIWEYLKGGD